MIKKIYQDAQFNPKFFGLFLNPFYFARKGLRKAISELTPNLSGRLLDIGCGTKPYKDLCNVNEYIGLEIDDNGNRNHSHADVFYDGISIPFDDEYFDCILANQVFEHVFNPNTFLKELNRVIRKDGHLLLTVPFVWDEHEQPYDFARYSSFGLKHILNENGFEIVEIRKSNNGIELIFQILNAYIFKTTKTNSTYMNLFITIIFLSPLNLLGLILSKIFPRNNDLYLDNIVLAKKALD